MAGGINVEDWELLSQVCQAFRTLTDSFMDQIDMHRAQAILLCQLYDRDGLSQSEIGEQLSVQGATVTNIVQRMEETGLVTRTRDLDDNRLVRVYLTEVGKKQERAIFEQFVKIEETVFAGFDETDRALLRRYLKQLNQNMEGSD